jgi:hypothetical protein
LSYLSLSSCPLSSFCPSSSSPPHCVMLFCPHPVISSLSHRLICCPVISSSSRHLVPILSSHPHHLVPIVSSPSSRPVLIPLSFLVCPFPSYVPFITLSPCLPCLSSCPLSLVISCCLVPSVPSIVPGCPLVQCE